VDVDGHGDGAEPSAAVHGLEPLRPVADHDRDAIAGGDTEAAQCSGGAANAGVELAIADAPLPEEQRRAPRPRPRLRRQPGVSGGHTGSLPGVDAGPPVGAIAGLPVAPALAGLRRGREEEYS